MTSTPLWARPRHPIHEVPKGNGGPVYAKDGKRFGTFNSIWRREKDGNWKVIFDKGCDYCEGND